MEKIIPPFLKRGDTIGVVSLSWSMLSEELQPAIHFFTSQGFILKTAPHIFSQSFRFAGTDAQRAADFMAMVEDKDVKAIVCAKGGYGIDRIIDVMNLRKLHLNPKWVVGRGDATHLHGVINDKYGIETIHAIMPSDYPRNIQGNEACSRMLDVLMGVLPSYSVAHNDLNKFGSSEGVLVGGSLRALAEMLGTENDIVTNGQILFIEHDNTTIFDVDRLLMQLKRCGKIDSIKGLIVGDFYNIAAEDDAYNLHPYQIISRMVQDYNFPVCFGFMEGPDHHGLPLIMGRNVKLEVNSSGAQIDFSDVSNFGVGAG